MPTSANDGGIWRGGEHDCLCMRMRPLKVREKIINSQKEKENDSKKWLQQYGRVDVVTHLFEDDDDDVRDGGVFGFYNKEQWAFNMQLRICLSASLWCPAASVAFQEAYRYDRSVSPTQEDNWLPDVSHHP